MGARRPQRPAPGHAMLLARVGDDATQRALDAVKTTTAQVQKTAAALATTVDGLSAGRLLRAPQIFTASGSYVRAPGTAIMHVRMCAAGGGGGGASASAGTLSIAGSGASGETIDLWLTGDAVGDGTVTFGAAGAGGAAGANPGTPGGDAALAIGATTYLAKGGGGGAAGNQNGAVGTVAGGSPQAGSTAGVPATADAGTDGVIVSATGGGIPLSTHGGSGAMGTGGSNGGAASGFGAGGSGGIAVSGIAAGMPGTGCYLEIREYS